MPFSTRFTAHLNTNHLQISDSDYLISAVENSNVEFLFPMASDSPGLIKAALEQGFLSPEEEAFWNEELAQWTETWPMSFTVATHLRAFCETYVSLRVLTGESLKPESTILLMVYGYDTRKIPLRIEGVIKEIMSI